VLVVAVHGLAQVHEVGEHRLLGAFASHLGQQQQQEEQGREKGRLCECM
jgi:hypothetical protein